MRSNGGLIWDLGARGVGGGQGRGVHETRLTTNSPAVITQLQ